MLRRSITPTILIALIITFVAAAALWSLQRQTSLHTRTEHERRARAGEVTRTLLAIATVQQGYVAPGQLDAPLFEQMGALLAQLDTETKALAALVKSPAAVEHRQSLAESLKALTEADTRARQNLRRGQELMAADVIYSDGRNIIDAIAKTVRDIEAAEQGFVAESASRASNLIWALFGVMTLVWAGACVSSTKVHESADGPSAEKRVISPPPVASPPRAAPSATRVDRAALAALCTDLSRVSDASRLQGLLERTGRVLHASGVMLWMSAGERLFAAVAHGYPNGMLPRLVPLGREADNAAAQSWREGRQVVRPGGSGEAAALVTPLFSHDACMGVLAVELKKDVPPDEELAAAASVVAAQLATVVSAWPAASTIRTSAAHRSRRA